MGAFLDFLWMIGTGIWQLVLSPFLYAGIVLMILFYQRQAVQERKMFHVCMHEWKMQFWRSMFFGFTTGVFTSAIALPLGVYVTLTTMYWLWGVAFVLAIFSIRRYSMLYSVAVITVMQQISLLSDWSWAAGAVQDVVHSLQQMELFRLFLLAALVQMVEALTLWYKAPLFTSPVFVYGKRGKLVGAYRLQAIAITPFLVLAPTVGGEQLSWSAAWTTLLQGDYWLHGHHALLGVPLLLAFTESTQTMLPTFKFRNYVINRIVISGIIIALVIIFKANIYSLILAAVTIGLYEWMLFMSREREKSLPHFYTNNESGLRVLAVVPNSSAYLMGIEAGETIKKVNGEPVSNVQEMHTAIHRVAAYCKMEVENLEKQIKFVHRARYANDHHQLGIIVAPDDHTNVYVDAGSFSLLELFRRSYRTMKKQK